MAQRSPIDIKRSDEATAGATGLASRRIRALYNDLPAAGTGLPYRFAANCAAHRPEVVLQQDQFPLMEVRMHAATASIFSPGTGSSRREDRRRCRLPLAFFAGGLLLLGGLFTACGDDGDMLPGDPSNPRPTPTATSSGDPDCPPATVCEDHPAAYAIRDPKTGSYGNYDLANRPQDGQDIRYIVIHTTDASWDLTLQIFTDPKNAAAAHYLVRSSDGQVAKFIAPRHVAWHAGNWYYNAHSIGIEHEAWAFEGHKWFTDALYASSAKLVRHLARRYGVPLDRAHILGHDEVPGINPTHQKTMHWDPGPYWDWDRYMKLLRDPGTTPAPPQTADTNEPADEQPDNGPEINIPGSVITIRPDYQQNVQDVTYCYSADESSDCRAAPPHPVHFLYLRKAPDPLAAVIENPYLSAWPGDRMYNWGNKVGTGTRWVRSARMGDWDGIYFSGQLGWFYNPGRQSTRRARATVVTPRAGLDKVPVFGVGYPQAPAFHAPQTPVAIDQSYEILAGQRYVAVDRVTGDYYWARTFVKPEDFGKDGSQVVVKDTTQYFQINFDHREALVRVTDMDIVPSP